MSARARIRGLLGRRAIAYHPAFAAVGGGATAGLFLAQLFYWHDRGRDPDGWIYKTQAEWEAETGLTRWQQETARRKLRARGLLEEKLAGIPARLHYRLDVERLIQLLSPQVHLTAAGRPSGGGGEGPGSTGERRRPVDSPPPPADRSRSRSRDPHNQDCGIPTNKHVGTPQTSSRGFRRHAETTREDSREQGAESLAAGFQESSSGRLTPPATSSADRSADRLGVTPDGTPGVTPDVPSEVMCSLHGVPMRLREKDGDRWYSHRLDDGAWCKGARGDYALGDHAQGQARGRNDPQSVEFRREYLAWADPDTRLEFRQEDYAAYAAYANYAAYAEADDGAEPQADTAARRAALAGGDAAGAEARDADPPQAQVASSCAAQRASSCAAPGASSCPGQPADPRVGALPKPPPGPPAPGPPPTAPRAPPGEHRGLLVAGFSHRLQHVPRLFSGQVCPDVPPLPAGPPTPAWVTARGPPGRTTHRGGRAARDELSGMETRPTSLG